MVESIDLFTLVISDLTVSAEEARGLNKNSLDNEAFNEWCILAVNLIQNKMTNTSYKVRSLKDTLNSFQASGIGEK